MDAIHFQTLERFSGVNNVDDAPRLFPAQVERYIYAYPLLEGNNVLIDNTFGLASRSGYTEVLAGTEVHSLWAAGSMCFFVDGTDLYRLHTDYTSELVRSGLDYGRMSYVAANDRVYYTNYYQIGYYRDGDNAVMDPEREFKLPLPSGQLITFFMGCLMVARDNILYISDPLCDYYDVRHGYRAFKSTITMLRSVVDGLYISDDDVYFVRGRSNEDFEKDPVYSSAAVAHTDVLVPAGHVGGDAEGYVALWTSQNGICMGKNNGEVTNLTEARYKLQNAWRGAAFIRDKDNVRHYINTLY